MNEIQLNSIEWRASLSLAALFACRMLGLFLLLPVFIVSIYEFPGSEISWLVGLTAGIYGLIQAIMQIPLGFASDFFGRKKIVLIGLTLFVFGGIVCALAENLFCLTIGRAIQGMGAISSVITAWLADVTRQEVRARAMAIIGSSIGISFAFSIIISPLLVSNVGLHRIFWIMVFLGILGLIVANFYVPSGPAKNTSILKLNISNVFLSKNLMKMNFGVFVLHFILTALFLIIPKLLLTLVQIEVKQLWKIYLPIILISFLFMIALILITEKYKKHAFMLRLMIMGLMISQLLLLWATFKQDLTMIIVSLVGFFAAFNVLEALQPSMISRFAPKSLKGLALGIYNTSQSLGLFFGGFIGGLLTNSERSFETLCNHLHISKKEIVFFHLKLPIDGITTSYFIITVLTALWLIASWNLKFPSRSCLD